MANGFALNNSKIEIIEVFRKEDYESPFDENVTGFQHEDWWFAGSVQDTSIKGDETRYFTFKYENTEIARAIISPIRNFIDDNNSYLAGQYINFFEVAILYRNRGLGQLCVQELLGQYKPSKFYLNALDQNAIRFWQKCGFQVLSQDITTNTPRMFIETHEE